MMVFIAVPVIAPSLGQAVLLFGQWRGIFLVLMLYGFVALVWNAMRMPETLPESERRSLAIRDVLDAFRQTVTNRQTIGYALAAAGVMGSLFAYVLCSQQVFTGIYGLGHYFPIAFAAIAVGTAIAGFLNARFVGRLGMRVISHGALMGFVAVAGDPAAGAKLGIMPLALFMALSALMMFFFGLMIANFTSLAMEPQGHIAGTASSLYGSITTLLGIGIGSTIGQDFDGTLVPFATGFFLCTLASLGGGAGDGEGPVVPAAWRAGGGAVRHRRRSDWSHSPAGRASKQPRLGEAVPTIQVGAQSTKRGCAAPFAGALPTLRR